MHERKNKKVGDAKMTSAEDLIDKHAVKFDVNDAVSRFIGEVQKKGETYALLFKGEDYAGYADKKSLVKSRTDLSKTKLASIIKRVPILSREMNLIQMAKAFIDADARTLPVFEGKKLLGVIHSKDVVYEIKDSLKKFSASDFATTRNLVVLEETDQIGNAIHQMHGRKVDRAPVVDEKRNFMGIVTIIDLQIFLLKLDGSGIRCSKGSKVKSGRGAVEPKKAIGLPVKNIMSSLNCCTSSSDESVFNIIKKMHECNASSCVLLEENRPVGIITVHDILNGFLKSY